MLSKKLKEELRIEQYNAEIISFERKKDDLAIIRIRPDDTDAEYTAGQFISLGLFNFEGEGFDGEQAKLIKRPYSVSSPIVDTDCQLWDIKYRDFYELYIVLVEDGELTPLIFNCELGSRLFVTKEAKGTYVLPDKINPDDTIIFASTGTGLAPHNSMMVELLPHLSEGKVIVFDCVRYYFDLAYSETLDMLRDRYDNLIYIPLCTREDGNKLYIQDFFKNDTLLEEYGVDIDPKKTHVFCCGNPAMIGMPKLNRSSGKYSFQFPDGLIEILMKKYDMTIFSKKIGGNIHFEKYW